MTKARSHGSAADRRNRADRATPPRERDDSPAAPRARGTPAPSPVARRPQKPLPPFAAAVARVVRRIPRGTTVSYGEVALRLGKPGAARAVVQALRLLDDVPWWRVGRKDGTLAPQVAFEQAQMLASEGWKPK